MFNFGRLFANARKLTDALEGGELPVISTGLPTFEFNPATMLGGPLRSGGGAQSCESNGQTYPVSDEDVTFPCGDGMEGTTTKVCGAGGKWTERRNTCVRLDSSLSSCAADGGWTAAAAGELVAKACSVVMPAAATGDAWEGTASRQCGADATWLPAMTSRCGLRSARVALETATVDAQATLEAQRQAAEAAAVAQAAAARLAVEAEAAKETVTAQAEVTQQVAEQAAASMSQEAALQRQEAEAAEAAKAEADTTVQNAVLIGAAVVGVVVVVALLAK